MIAADAPLDLLSDADREAQEDAELAAWENAHQGPSSPFPPKDWRSVFSVAGDLIWRDEFLNSERQG